MFIKTQIKEVKMVAIKQKLLKNFLIYTSSIILLTCGGSDGGGPTEPEEPTYIVNLVSLGGAAQKGPFNNGTIINIAELNNSLTPTGKNFTSQIIDNSGTFSVSNVQMEFSYAQINASGFYFDEVGNKVSSAQLVLTGISNLAGKTNMNVNVMSTLEMNRIKNLITGDSPLTFAQAKIQAQEEVLAIFGFSRSGIAESELLDISKSGDGNAKLLAISAILQGDRTVGQLSELLANISTDITADGTLDDSNIIESLRQSAYNLDLQNIRNNLESRYNSLGLNVNIPDFESEVNNFYKPPVANDMNVSTDEDTDISITLDASDPEGESLTFSTVEINNATVTISGNTATYSPDANFNGTDTFTYIANDGSFNSNTATVTVNVGAIDDEPNTNDINTSTNEDVSVVMNLTADEYDGDSYSFAIRSNPLNGSVTLSSSQATYTPNQDFNGEDSFTFEASDDTGRTINVATATITVNAVNDAPVANDITNQVTDENRMMQLDITLD
ncbi:MAG: Ig-like domain-containing protein, partial [Candidatus Neomarinimicrobiota bacterium]